MGTIVRGIREHAFFEAFPDELFKELRTCADKVSYDVDQLIYKQGDPAEEFFLILQGRVALELYAGHHGAMIVQTVGAGEILGWSWLFTPYRRHFDARALTPVAAICLQAHCMREQAERNHLLGHELYKRFSRAVVASLQAARLQLLDVYSRSPAHAHR